MTLDVMMCMCNAVMICLMKKSIAVIYMKATVDISGEDDTVLYDRISEDEYY